MRDYSFRRITDWNHSIHCLKKHTSFEAAFSLDDDGAIYLRGKVIDSDNREIFCSNDIREMALGAYQDWEPEHSLAEFIEAIESETVDVETAYFKTPLSEMSLEVKGPIANPQVFGITITMALNFSVLELYQWKDSGSIRIAMLCHKDHLLTFAKGLQADLFDLQKTRDSLESK